MPRRPSGQLFGAGTSIGSNVHEGQAAQSGADFITQYAIALKEANETVYWLRLLIASKLLAYNPLPAILAEAGELAKVIGRCIVTAGQNDPKPKRVP